MNPDFQRPNIPPLENIILPVEYDPYIKYCENLTQLAANSPKFVQLNTLDSRHRLPLSKDTSTAEILRTLDRLASYLDNDTTLSISSYEMQTDAIVFETEREASPHPLSYL